jgi:chromosome segregation ATPase
MPYIKANTPEYLNLQSQNQQLQQQLSQSQSDNQQLQQQLSQSQSENQRFQQELQDAQQTIDQQNSAANDLNQQLTSNKNLAYGLGGLAAIMAALAVHYRGQRGKIVNYPQQQYAQQQYAASQEQNVSTPKQEPGASS